MIGCASMSSTVIEDVDSEYVSETVNLVSCEYLRCATVAALDIDFAVWLVDGELDVVEVVVEASVDCDNLVADSIDGLNVLSGLNSNV